MTLFAMILAIGIVVDDAIVIVENPPITSRRASSREAAIKAMGEMTGPILGITLVLTAVFLPAAFMPASPGSSSANSP